MIYFNAINDFNLNSKKALRTWIETSAEAEQYILGAINYVFCNDDYLLEKNIKYLKHNTLTDIISFDYTFGKEISGDIFISTERVKENSVLYKTAFRDELHRVMIHGILHYCGYTDKTEADKAIMRSKEDYYLSLRDF